MKEGCNKGRGHVRFIVQDNMVAELDGKLIHPVCSTYWLVYYAEVAARRAIEPFFDDNENAVGAGIELQHKAMAAPGCEVDVTAEVVHIQGNRIRCTFTVTATKTNTLLAEGIQDQVVMRTEVLSSRIRAAVR